MATILFERISPEPLPATEAELTVMPGHEPTMAMLNSGIIAVTPAQGHGGRAFVQGGFVEIAGRGVSVLAGRALPPEELTRERLDEEVVHPEAMRDAMRDDRTRRDANFAISRSEQVKTTLSF